MEWYMLAKQLGSLACYFFRFCPQSSFLQVAGSTPTRASPATAAIILSSAQLIKLPSSFYFLLAWHHQASQHFLQRPRRDY